MMVLGANTRSIEQQIMEKVRLQTLGLATAAAQVQDFAVEMETAKNKISKLQLGETRVNLRAEGLSLDGTTDQAAAFEAVVAASPDGSIFALPEGARLMLSRQVLFNGKPFRLEGYGDATIAATQVLTNPMLRIINADDIEISGIAFEGAESAFENTNTTYRFALEIITCDYTSVRDIHVTGFSRGVNIEFSDHVVVDGVTYVGLLNGFETWAQYHNGLRIIDCDYPLISGITGINCGSALLVGSVSLGGRVWGLTAINCWDNAVYLSSAEGWDVGGVFARFPAGSGTASCTGVKARGSRHKVHHCDVDGYGTSYVLTPIVNATAYGSELSHATGTNAQYHGAIIEEAGTGVPRNFKLLYNTFEGAGQDGGAWESVRVVSGDDHKTIGNEVYDQVGTAAAYRIQGSSDGARASGHRVLFNVAEGLPAASTAMGYQLTWLNDSLIGWNEFGGITAAQYGMRLFQSSRDEVIGNRPRGTAGTTAVIRVHDAGSVDNWIHDNPLATISDIGTTTKKWGNGNGNPSVSGATTADRLASLEGILQAQKRIA